MSELTTRRHQWIRRRAGDGPHRPHLLIGGDRPAALRHLVEVLGPDGVVATVPPTEIHERDDGLVAAGSASSLRVEADLRKSTPVVELALTVTYEGDRPLDAGLRVAVELPGRVATPRWLVPGCFYQQNRPEHGTVRYPRAVVSGGDPQGMESSWWSFRSDRAAAPVVLGWTDAACVGLAGEPTSPLGLTGLGFAAEDPGPRVWLDFPYREEPVVYRGDPDPAPADVRLHRWLPGEQQRLHCLVYLAPPEPHAYDAFLRELYRRDRSLHPLAPWMDVDAAAALTAHGLHAWHWRPDDDALYETAAFDRAHPALDRPHMHVAWVSGVPWAHALLAYGRRIGEPAYVDAGTRVIDRITEASTPAGTFWGEWTKERGWRCGWNRDPDLLHARTLAEATLFTLRALRLERRHGDEHPAWAAATVSNLEFAAGCQDVEGNLGSYYHQATGDVVAREGAAGILWIAALVEGADQLRRPELLDVARRAGHHYASFVDDAFIYGAPEDVHLAPTSEDAYNALIAYLALHTADPDRRWLELARRAADWMMTFRWTYDIAFDEHTLLHQYGFRTRGADQASPTNQHLHAYGLVALGELLGLWRRTGDRYYLQRAQDNLACFLQLIARADGDFNARKGMVTERYYQTNCFQPKGSILTLSHAWCVGVTLHGCLVALDDPEAFPPGLAWAGTAADELPPRRNPNPR